MLKSFNNLSWAKLRNTTSHDETPAKKAGTTDARESCAQPVVEFGTAIPTPHEAKPVQPRNKALINHLFRTVKAAPKPPTDVEMGAMARDERF